MYGYSAFKSIDVCHTLYGTVGLCNKQKCAEMHRWVFIRHLGKGFNALAARGRRFHVLSPGAEYSSYTEFGRICQQYYGI